MSPKAQALYSLLIAGNASSSEIALVAHDPEILFL